MFTQSLSLSAIKSYVFCLAVASLIILDYPCPAQIIRGENELSQYSNSGDSSNVDSLIAFAWDHKYSAATQSLNAAQEALRLANKLRYARGTLDALSYLGQQFGDWGNFPKALYYYQQALQKAKEIHSTKDLVRVYLYLGQLYDDKEEFNNALAWYRKAETQALANHDSLFISFAVGDQAIIMDKTGHLDSAYRLMQKSLAYLSNGVGTRSDSSSTYNNLALNQKRQGRYDKALAYLLQTKEMLQGTPDSMPVLIWYDNMGSLYTAMKKLPEAKLMLDTALSIIPSVNSLYTSADIYENLSHYYEAKEDYANALQWYKKSAAIKDTLQKQEQVRQFDALQIQYGVEEKEIQLARQSAKIEEQHTLILAAVIASAILLLFAALLWSSNRQRKKANKLLLGKNNEIVLQKERLQQVNEVKDRLFSIISHDLKSPMESLRYYLKLLTNDRLDKVAVQETAKELGHYFSNIRNMMDNLLYWVSTQIKGWQLHKEDLRLADVVDEVLTLVTADAARKSIRVINNMPDGLHAYADPNLLKLALRNILSNAVKFTPSNGDIYISGDEQAKHVRISVRDTGKGMSPEKLEQFSADIPLTSEPGTGQEKGTGLGILVSRQLLAKQAGNLQIDSIPGKGTTVTIDLAMATESTTS